MSFLNLNTLQTLLSGLLVAIPFLLKATGCVDGPPAAGSTEPELVCTASVLSPTIIWAALAVVSAVKFVIIPWLQPGGLLRNLFEPKVPVSSSGLPGTVTQAQVDSGPKN